MPRLFPNLSHKAKLSGQNQDFFAILILGLALLLFSPILPFYAILAWVRLHLVVVRYEEPMLARIFGDENDEYRKQAGRWLPLLRRQALFQEKNPRF